MSGGVDHLRGRCGRRDPRRRRERHHAHQQLRDDHSEQRRTVRGWSRRTDGQRQHLAELRHRRREHERRKRGRPHRLRGGAVAIDRCFAAGAVSVSGSNDSTLGGLVGLQDTGVSIANSYATGAVLAATIASVADGGLVGYELGNTVSSTYAMGYLSTASGDDGFAVSRNCASLSNCHCDSTTTGSVGPRAASLRCNASARARARYRPASTRPSGRRRRGPPSRTSATSIQAASSLMTASAVRDQFGSYGLRSVRRSGSW